MSTELTPQERERFAAHLQDAIDGSNDLKYRLAGRLLDKDPRRVTLLEVDRYAEPALEALRAEMAGETE